MAATKGQLKWWGRRYSVRVTFADGKRRWVALPEGISHQDAGRRAEALAVDAARRPAPADTASLRQDGETFGRWAERWLEARTAAGHSTSRDHASRLKCHVLPLLETKPIAAIDAEDIERVRDRLDQRIVSGEISWSTAAFVWALVRKMFSDASKGKDRDLRVRTSDPTRDVLAPERGAEKSKQFLYPDEFLQLVGCKEVPLVWRRTITLAVYLALRQGELRALTWEDLDLEHGVAHVHRSVPCHSTVAVDQSTKTGGSRRLPIEPTLVPLLRLMRREAKGTASHRVLPEMPWWYDLPKGLRLYVGLAGLTRRELLARGPTRRWLTFHDLRATGITWMAVRGDDPLKIRQRVGHAHLSTTERYIRLAETLDGAFGQTFPCIPLGSEA